MKKTLIIYLPALHQGYINFLKEHTSVGSRVILINGSAFAKKYPLVEHLERDLRAIPTIVIHTLLESLFQECDIFGQKAGHRDIRIAADIDQLNILLPLNGEIIMSDDDVTSLILDEIPQLQDRVNLQKMFLRWDKNASLLENEVNVPIISENALPRNVVMELKNQIGKSIDWWRQVACVIYDDAGKVLLATYNRHLSNDLVLNIFGDPRFNFKPGEHIENCTAIHSEAWAIAQAAREGISLKGLNMIVSDFPCPVCAKSIAETGIKKLFFVRGYSKIDGQKMLEDRGIELQKVVFQK